MFVTHLHQNMTGATPVEKAPSRNGYGEGLLEAGRRDERVVALSADLTESTRTLPFAEAFPKRFVQVGITEQNMASLAAGMAMMGKVPFIASYAMFSPGRNWEQIRTTIAYNNSNVKIIGAHAGVSVGPDGATHQAIEDIALMRVLPNMVVINPVDVHEARKATLWAAKYEGPVYIRIGRSDTAIVTTAESPFEIGKAQLFHKKNPDLAKTVGIISTGQLTYEALLAAAELESRGIGVGVLHIATIKPFDTEGVVDFAREHGLIITLEEHQRVGGLGGLVAETLAEHAPTRVVRLGVADQYGQSGEPEELLRHYGLDKAAVVAAAVEAVL
ncbi:MAG: transketolase family protein [Candidatus Pacebacteria bacterium]|jgi:transketolase|nr:transketolase family protein [Candidatus Paceibacterota bacterium]